MGHIFISYSHKDKECVHGLQEDLLKQGFNVWIDDRIDYGTRWPKVIQDHLDECDAFIVIVSENSFDSEWVQNEVTRAKRIGKPFFPLLLSGSAWLSIESTQYVDVTNQEMPPEKFYERLSQVTPRGEHSEHSVEETLTKRDPAESPAGEAPKFKFSIKQWWWVIAMTLGMIGIGFVLWMNGTFQPAAILAPTATSSPTFYPSATASLTPTQAVTSTPELSSSPTALSGQSAPMILYPAGNFIMGSNEGNDDEKPVHTVFLDAYYIDKYNVTNALHKACVDAQVCAPPKFNNSYLRPTYYGDPRYDQYPVLGVNWDMAGNLWEWVADIYDANYYASLTLPVANPLGPTTGPYRVIRGGSWDSDAMSPRSARCSWNDPSNANIYIGFRCARNP